MHFLALDIGNSFTKLGIFQNEALVSTSQFETQRSDVSRFPEQLHHALQAVGLIVQPPQGIAFCSSVPELSLCLKPMLMDLYPTLADTHCLHVQAESAPFTIDTSRYVPNQLGVDRLVVLTAAKALYPSQPLIVVSMGTATTINALNAEGTFLGGIITPGFALFINQLTQAAPHLPQPPYTEIKTNSIQTLGLNTQGCLWLGSDKAYVLMIEALLSQMLTTPELAHAKLVLAGGDAETFSSAFERHKTSVLAFDSVNPTLALSGLYEIFKGLNADGLTKYASGLK
jgi:type III pantothenate kinase